MYVADNCFVLSIMFLSNYIENKMMHLKQLLGPLNVSAFTTAPLFFLYYSFV